MAEDKRYTHIRYSLGWKVPNEVYEASQRGAAELERYHSLPRWKRFFHRKPRVSVDAYFEYYTRLMKAER